MFCIDLEGILELLKIIFPHFFYYYFARQRLQPNVAFIINFCLIMENTRYTNKNGMDAGSV